MFIQPLKFYSACISSLILLFVTVSSFAQPFDRYDTSWLSSNQNWIKLIVTSDNVYEVDVQQLFAHGFPNNQIPARDVRLKYRGNQIPVEIVKNSTGEFLQGGDKIRFIGKRNTGKYESWAYSYRDEYQPSTQHSLYTDQSFYWLTWTSSGQPMQYQVRNTQLSNEFYSGFRDTVHVEPENTEWYNGSGEQAEIPSYTDATGFFWEDFGLQGRDRLNFRHDLPMTDLIIEDSLIHFETRVLSYTGGRREANLQLFHDRDGEFDFHTIDQVSWVDRGGRTLSGSILPVLLLEIDEMEARLSFLNQSSNRGNPNGVFLDWMRMSYFRGFRLPTNTNYMSFWLRSDGNKSVALTNISHTDSVVVYHPDSQSLFTTVVDSASGTATFRNSQSSIRNQEYVVIRNQNFTSVPAIQAYNVTDDLTATSNEGEFIIITRTPFMEDAQRYADYRRQRDGYKTRVVNAFDIYNQFAYGSPEPIAIRRFLFHAFDNWEVPPKYVFILGDSRQQFRNVFPADNEIPTFGRPASDTWFTVNYGGPRDFLPRIAIGRLTVRNSQEIRAYLDKVQRYEAPRATLEPWQKRVAFLSGGNLRPDGSDDELQRLYSLNQGYANSTAESIVAADTVLFRKESDQPLDGTRREQLNRVINEGTLILQFFGHSSPDSWDLLTDNPNTFQNQNRSSVVLSLGCYSGLFTDSQERIISEQFVFAQNAAVAYIGGSGQGYISSLSKYSEYFFNSVFNDTVRVLGDVDRIAKRRLVSGGGTFIDNKDLALSQNSIFLGDPAIKLQFPNRPDYLIEPDGVTFTPESANVSDSTLIVDVTVRNQGIRTNQIVDLEMVHRTPTNQTNRVFQTLMPISRSATITYEIPLRPDDSGVHDFNFMVDPELLLDEADRTNNEFSTQNVVFSTGVDLISPLDKGVVNSELPTFFVASPSALDGDRFLFEVDSLSTFNNPVIPEESVESENVNISWTPQTQLQHGETYYWRTRVDKPGEVNWRTTTFHVDTTLTGTWWLQDHKTFHENEYSPSIRYDFGEFNFQPVSMEVRTSTNSWQHSRTEDLNYPASIFVNGVEYARRRISFHVMIINGSTGRIEHDQHYMLHAGVFTNEGAGTVQQFVNVLNNARNGDYVVIRVRNFRLISSSAQIMTSSVMNALRSVGGFRAGAGVDGQSPSELRSTDGYILFGRKGARSPDEVSEYINRTGVIERDTVFTFNEPEGTMESPFIGPAKSWNSLQTFADMRTNNGLIQYNVYGYQTRRGEPQLITTVGGFQREVTASLANIDAQRYPYIKLQSRFADASRQNTPQLKQWRVSYDPVPELAVDPNRIYTVGDEIEEGYRYDFGIDIRNIGMTLADSAIVKFYHSYNTGPIFLSADTLYNIAPGELKRATTSVETLGRVGDHQIHIELSDEISDLYQYNNFHRHRFEVTPDTTNPRVEVFVDNRYLPPVANPIMDKNNPALPFVQAQPTIDIYWRDSNPFLRLADSTLLEIELFAGDDQANAQIFSASSPEVFFEGASDDVTKRNEAFAQFRPDFSGVSDSVFTMRVYARDPSQNVADGETGYTISFRVNQESSISSFYPYPNPMNNFTTFAFELSGKNVEQVDDLRLRIFTPSGQPVRTFDLKRDQYLLQDGRLQIGWNLMRWDGRDEDGDLLANGVYLYKVYMRADGESVSVNNSRSVERLVIIR